MSSQLILPCLGRPFNLGMLYDCHTDTLIPGLTLWDSNKLKSFSQKSTTPGSNYNIIGEDTIKKKSHFLDISAELKLSFLCGLVKVDGAAKYLQNTRNSTKQSRVTLQYTSTTHFEQLTMDQIGDIQFPEVLDDHDATHVVNGITYGADAFFVFDRTVVEGEKSNTVHANLKAAVEAIGKNSGGGLLNYKGTDEEETEKFNCTFHGDLILPSNPSTYSEAIELYKNLPSRLNGESGSVPKKVHLIPISKLKGGRATQMVQSITFDLISDVEVIMKEFHETEMFIYDLLKYPICSKFVNIATQLSTIENFLTRFKMRFVSNLAKMLPEIRRARVDEKELAELISSVKESPFTHRIIMNYLNQKKKEIVQLTRQLSNMEKVSSIQFDFPDTACDLEELVADDLKYIVCFAFNVTCETSTYLNNLEGYLQNGTITSSSDKEWFNNQEIITKLRNESKKFVDFVKANANEGEIAFVVTHSNNEANGSDPCIVFYHDTVPMPFNSPGVPTAPKASNITTNSIDVSWKEPSNSEAVSYQVLCTASDGSSSRCYPTKSTSFHVAALSSGIEYEIQIQAFSESGLSTKSEITCIKTETAQTTARLVDNFLQDSKCIEPLAKPPVYQLPLMLVQEDQNNCLRKFEIVLPGSPVDAYKQPPEKVLMVLGATGAGKSTLLNGIANYILGVRWEDDFRFKLINEEGNKSQSKSQTTFITAYSFRCDKDAKFNLTVVDTPGFGDTDGIERDKKITRQIRTFFSEESICSIDVIHGIGFVTQASLARLTAPQRYVFDSVLSIFGKDIRDNIFLMTTFADANDPQVIESVKDADIPYKEFFKFNNSALFAANQQKTKKSTFNSMFWEMGIASFDEFFEHFSVAEPKSLNLTKEVLKEREQLEVLIPALKEQVRTGMSKLDEIQQEKRILSQREADINANKHFTYQVKVEKFEKVDLKPGIHTTTCQVCNFTCHENCAISNDGDKSNCCAMMNGTCRNCPKKCHWSSHFNVPYIFRYYEAVETRDSNDLKKKYDTASSEKKKSEAMIANNEEILLQKHVEVHLLIGRTHQSIERLHEIALKQNPLTELEYLDILIESEKKDARAGWEKRIEQYLEFRKDAELYKQLSTSSNIDSVDLMIPPEARPGWKKRFKMYLEAKGEKLMQKFNKAKM